MVKLAGKSDKIKTFSVVFPGSKLDESKYMNEVIKYTDVFPYKIKPTARELVSDLRDLIRTLEEPFPSFSMYGTYRLYKLTSDSGIKVLLNGQGSDEMLAGYSHYIPLYLKYCLKTFRIKEVFFLLIQLFRTGYWKNYLSILFKKKIFKEKCFVDFGTMADIVNDFPKTDLNNLLLRDFTLWILPSLLRYDDRNSMKWHVESRTPFLDHRLVEYIFSLPPEFKFKRGISKYILRKVIKGIVPDIIVERKDKVGFQFPDEDWLSSPEFQNFLNEIFNSEKFKSRKYWNYEKLKRIYEKFLKKKSAFLFGVLWRAVNIHIWLEEFFEK